MCNTKEKVCPTVIEWDPDIKRAWDQIRSLIPDTFRQIATEMIEARAELDAQDENCTVISEKNFLRSLLAVCPNSFRPWMISEVEKLGLPIKKYMDDIKIVQDAFAEIPVAFQPKTALHIIWQITENCNGNCRHCRVDATRSKVSVDIESARRRVGKRGRRDPPKELIFRWLDDIIETWNHPIKKLVFTITGGEPLIRPDIWEILSYFKQKVGVREDGTSETGHCISFASNGLLIGLKPELAKKLRDHGVTIIFISIDSIDPEINDTIRGVEGALEKQLTAIKACTEAGMTVIMSCVVQKSNYTTRTWQPLAEVADRINKDCARKPGAGICYFYPGFLIRTGRAHKLWDEIGLTKEQYKQFYEERFEVIMKTIREGKGKEIPLMDCFDLIPFMEIPRTPEDREILGDLVGCQACRCVIGVGVNGDVYPCEFVSETVLGNLNTAHLIDIYNGPLATKIRDRTERRGPCASCHHLDMCGGGCILFQEAMYGDILRSWPYCWHQNDHDHKGVMNKCARP